MKKLLLIVCMACPGLLLAQSTNVPLNTHYYDLVDRYLIKFGPYYDNVHPSIKPYRRDFVGQFADSLLRRGGLNQVDRFNLMQMAVDNFEWSDSARSETRKPFLKYFYQHKPDLLTVDVPNFNFHVRPVFHFSAGLERDVDATPYINTRGVEARGLIGQKIGFYTFLATTQAGFPNYVDDYISRYNVPGEGFWKKFKDNGVDFFTARGYISFPVIKDVVDMQFGYDKSFYGNGMRSVILSDFSSNYLFLRVNTNVWKLNYQLQFGELIADAPSAPSGSIAGIDYPKKYHAYHHLSFNIGKKLNLGVFESVIYGKPDSLGTAFELSYLNPVIFYRALEQQTGSTGNVLLGIDGRWQFLDKVMVYAQFTLDEFLLEEFKSGDGWWGNKWGLQSGIKYIDAFGVSNLDLHGELNIVRPYAYAHQDLFTNYSHYNQPLAHPLGANFREIVGSFRYQPFPKWTFQGTLMLAQTGRDTLSSNYGQNVLLSYNTRESDFGNEIGQGIATDITYADFTISYQLWHNLFIDLQQVLRRQRGDLSQFDDDTFFTSLALRWNIPQRKHVF